MKSLLMNALKASAIVLCFFLAGTEDIKAQYCSGTTNLTASSGTFSDGSGSSYYMDYTNCSWLIQPSQAAASITLTFSAFSLESCCDYVRIYNGTSTSAPLIGSYNGSSIPPSITSSGGALYVTFTSDGSVTYQGWTASYTSVSACTTTTPTITASGPTSFCGGGSVVLTSSTASTYLWSTGATTQSITVTQSGDYTVKVTDANGCGATAAPVTVTNNGPSVAASSNLSSVCAGGTVQLNASAGSSLQDNFDPLSTFQWLLIEGGIASTSCGAVSGNALYFDGYPARQAVTKDVNVASGGTISFSFKLAYNSAYPCEGADSGDDVLLQYSTNGGASWTTFNTFYGGMSTYQNFTTVNINIPAGAMTASTRFRWNQPYYAGSGTDNWAIDNVSISGSNTGNYTYSWSPSTGVSNSTIANPTAVVNSNTTYSVTVTDANTACSNTASVSVTTFAPATATITATGSTTFCQGGSVMLTANTGVGYLWSNGDTTKSITVSQAGSYTVTVTYAGGCTSTSAATAVTVNSATVPTVTASGPTSFCAGGSVVLTSSTANAYLWSNGATTKTVTLTQTGNYTVTITDANGCKATSAPITVTNNGPSVVASSNLSSVCVGGTVQLNVSGGSSLQDNFDPMVSSNWTSVTGGVASNSCGSVSGNALYFDGSSVREAVTKTLNVLSGGTINFSLKIAYSASYPCESADFSEDVVLQYSTNGSTWNDISIYYAGSNTYQNFTSVSAVIPSGAMTSSTKFRWTQTYFSGSGYDNWAIDNVSISGGSTGNFTYSWSPSASVSDPTIANPTAVVNSNTTYSVTVTDVNTACSNTASVSVTTFTPATATITTTGSTTFCQGGSVVLTANTGVGYLWSNGDSTKTITASQGSNYTVTVTYAGGCTSTSAATTVTVNSATVPTVTASGATSFCGGESVALTSSTANAYLWSNGAPTQSVTISQSGNYTVTITDANGCKATSAPVTVTNNGPMVSASSNLTSVCTGGSIQLNSIAGTYLQENFDPITSSQWLSTTGGAVSTSCGSVTGSALYFNGSSTREAITKDLNLSGGGTITFSLKIAYNTSSPCSHAYYGNDVQLQYSTNNGVSWNYLMTYYAGSSTYQNFTSLTVSIPTGAMTNATRFKWSQPYHYGMSYDNWAIDNISILPSNNSNFTYSWSPSNGLSNPNVASPTAVVSSSTTYVVTATDVNSGCSNTASVAITALPLPTASITANGPTEFCQGGNVSLAASTASGYTYQWQKNSVNISSAINSTYSATTSGSYAVLVTKSGCSSVSSPITVTVSSSAVAYITTSGPIEFCRGDSVKLTANSGTSYAWSNGYTTRSITVKDADNYYVTITNPGGCTGTATSSGVSVTVNPLPPVPTITQSGNTYISSSPTGNQWYINGNIINGATSQTLTSTLAGIYTVKVTNQYGCSSLSSDPTAVTLNPVKPGELTVYPSPFSQETTISYSLNSSSVVSLEVYNALGARIATLEEYKEQPIGEFKYKFNSSTPGVYFVILKIGSEVMTKKIISVR